ncbi:hypothetical protein O6H91_02G083700 [Diphasiastrum complanatum]|uniref:Uncharacterized protein n=1 Tax=Diphasiastrum complanatum TaxID=34168 RepID=A0ACC2EHF7_DIPCM|nr:hypothetical protein O6H91_02G083700 [Diphasiastrum complanatum]
MLDDATHTLDSYLKCRIESMVKLAWTFHLLSPSPQPNTFCRSPLLKERTLEIVLKTPPRPGKEESYRLQFLKLAWTIHLLSPSPQATTFCRRPLLKERTLEIVLKTPPRPRKEES